METLNSPYQDQQKCRVTDLSHREGMDVTFSTGGQDDTKTLTSCKKSHLTAATSSAGKGGQIEGGSESNTVALTKMIDEIVGVIKNVPICSTAEQEYDQSLSEPSENGLLLLSSCKESIRAELQHVFQQSIDDAWQNCKLTAFGSSVTGFGFNSSDLDLDLSVVGKTPTTAINTMVDALKSSKAFIDVTPVHGARVPILKVTHAASGVGCDITVNRPISVHNSALLKMYCSLDPRVRPLILCVKKWAKQRNINDTRSGSLSSYAWVNLVIYYLQQPFFGIKGLRRPILPNLQSKSLVARARSLSPGRVVCPGSGPCHIEGHDVSFCHDARALRVTPLSSFGDLESCGELLAGFFEFYAKQFKWWRTVVSIRQSPMKTNKSHAKFSSRSWCISIEDPFETTHDLGQVIYSSFRWRKILEEFHRAYDLLNQEEQGKDIATRIFDSAEKLLITCSDCGNKIDDKRAQRLLDRPGRQRKCSKCSPPHPRTMTSHAVTSHKATLTADHETRTIAEVKPRKSQKPRYQYRCLHCGFEAVKWKQMEVHFASELNDCNKCGKHKCRVAFQESRIEMKAQKKRDASTVINSVEADITP